MPPKLKKTLDTIDVHGAQNDEMEKLIDRSSGDEDEDFFLKGPTASKKIVRFASDKLNDVRVQVDEVTSVMRDNVGRLLDRGDQLDHLQSRSEDLAITSDQFRHSSTALGRKMWWENTRTKLCIALLLVLIFLIVFIPIIVKIKS